MSLIDLTYFRRGINVAQLSQPEVREVVESYVDMYEPYLLSVFLGQSLYDDLLQGLQATVVEQRWLDLKEWLANSTLKASPIANYVFSHLVYDEVTENTGIGIVSPQGENGTKATPVYKSVKAWNDMRIMLEFVHQKIRANISNYPNYKHKTWYSILGRTHGCGGKELFPRRNTLGL